MHRFLFRSFVAALLCLAAVKPDASHAQLKPQVMERLGVSTSINFGTTPYILVWSARPTSNYIKQEYLPAQETLEHYQSLLLLELALGDISVQQAVTAQLERLKARQATDPVTHMALMKHKDGIEMILDFVMQGKAKDGRLITEWNGYRYAPYTAPSGEKGVLLFAISRRAYGEQNSINFLKELRKNRQNDLRLLAAQLLPAIKPKAE